MISTAVTGSTQSVHAMPTGNGNKVKFTGQLSYSSILLWHWGRSGAGAKFTFNLARELRGMIGAILAVSSAKGSDLAAIACSLDDVITESVATFEGDKSKLSGKLAALIGLTRLPQIAYHFHRTLVKNRTAVALCTFQSIWDIATIPILSRGAVRSVIILHDAFFHPGDGYPLRHYALRRQIRNSDALIVLSDHVKQQAIKAFAYQADRIWTMPHAAFNFGTDTVHPAQHPRDVRPVRLLFFGRIVAYKGLDRLLLAQKALLARGIPVQLVIAGSGSIKPYVSLLADRCETIELHNHWLGDEEIANLLASSEIVVLPYIEASQSGVAAAAYAAGRPVVATPIGGLVEQVVQGSTGLLARDMSVEAFADAIAELVNQPDLLDHCAAGALAYARNQLSWKKSAETVIEVVETILVKPRRRVLAP